MQRHTSTNHRILMNVMNVMNVKLRNQRVNVHLLVPKLDDLESHLLRIGNKENLRVARHQTPGRMTGSEHQCRCSRTVTRTREYQRSCTCLERPLKCTSEFATEVHFLSTRSHADELSLTRRESEGRSQS